MTRYIDAEKAVARFEACLWGTDYDVVLAKSCIDDTPTADVVEVVRCKDCQYWKTETEPIGIECEPEEDAHYCDLGGITRTADFCSYGKRK